MRRNLSTRATVPAITFLAVALALTACSDGGGGGGTPGVTYTGVTTPAAITDANATDMTLGSYTNGTLGTSVSPLAVASGAPGPVAPATPLALLVAPALQVPIERALAPSPNAGVAAPRATVSDTVTVPGDCGGSAVLFIRADDVSGDFSGTATYNGFCQDVGEPVTLDGSASFSGKIDVASFEFIRFRLDIPLLTAVACGQSMTMSGFLAIEPTGPETTRVTLDQRIRDDATGLVFWMNNFVITATEGPGYTDVEETGRYYDPRYGYADISTETPLRILDLDPWPSSGAILAQGAVPVAGTTASAARLTAQGPSYLIEADIDGDGDLDDYSETLAWPTDLCTLP